MVTFTGVRSGNLPIFNSAICRALYIGWQPALSITGFVEHNSGRWASNTLKLDGYTVANLKAAYKLKPNVALEAGVNNLTDENYAWSAGFPSAGRAWFANVNYVF